MEAVPGNFLLSSPHFAVALRHLTVVCFTRQVISGHLGWVRSIAVEPGNQWFVTGSADRTIKVSYTEMMVRSFRCSESEVMRHDVHRTNPLLDDGSL